MRRSRRGGGEGWVFLLIAILILLGGAAGLVAWGRMVAARAAEQARANQREAAAAESKVVQSMRDAERESRASEPESAGPAAGERPANGGESPPEQLPQGPADAGRAVELARLIGRAVSAADTPARTEEAKKLVRGAAAELDSGRLSKDDAAALSTLRMAIGGAYRTLGEPALAVPYLKAAAEERAKRLGDRSPDAIRARMELEDAQRAASGAH